MKYDLQYVDDFFQATAHDDFTVRLNATTLALATIRKRMMMGERSYYWLDRLLTFVAGFFWAFGLFGALMR